MGMNLTIEINPIKGKMIDETVLSWRLLRAMQREVEVINREFNKTVWQWRSKPTFTKDAAIYPDKVKGTVSTDNKIYGYINNGTPIRHALMSDDWVSKTRPGFIGCGKGAGRVVAVSRKIRRPGIKARHFDTTISKRVLKRFTDKVNEEIAKGIGSIYK